MSAPLGMHGEDTVGDYSRRGRGRAVSRVNLADLPAFGAEPADSILVKRVLDGRTVWCALEAAVRPAPKFHPLPEDERVGVEYHGHVGRFGTGVKLADDVPADIVHALQDEAGR
jgi:hypothetical protein